MFNIDKIMEDNLEEGVRYDVIKLKSGVIIQVGPDQIEIFGNEEQYKDSMDFGPTNRMNYVSIDSDFNVIANKVGQHQRRRTA